jgi:branched-chain amino acid transport system substrate-binding protein
VCGKNRAGPILAVKATFEDMTSQRTFLGKQIQIGAGVVGVIQRVSLLLAVCLAIDACNSQNPERQNLVVKYEELPKLSLVVDSTFKLGALMDLSGPQSAEGKAQAKACELAVDDLNSQFEADGVGIKVELTTFDTASNLDKTLDGMFQLAREQGIRVFIGPYTSAELLWVAASAEASGLILISTGSTEASLAQRDTIFRMPTSDEAQAKITSDLMAENGSSAIIAVARGDAWTEELQASLEFYLSQWNAELLQPYEYDTDVTDFGGLATDIRDHIVLEAESRDPAEVGVHIEAFGEAAELLAALNKIANNQQSTLLGAVNQSLDYVNWYGSDGFAEEKIVLSNPDAAEFIVSKGMLAPRFAVPPENQSQFDALSARIGEQGSITVYSALAYDAAMLAGKTAIEVNKLPKGEGAGSDTDIAAWMDILGKVANVTTGISGSLAFNDEGDRDHGLYGLWSIKKDPAGNYAWYVVRYVPSR